MEDNPAYDVTVRSSEPAKAGVVTEGTRVGRYQLGEAIGGRATNTVYRARDTELERDVAIRVVAGGAIENRDRVLDEARAMAKVSHPALVPIFDVGTIGDDVFMVMPLLSGGTLRDWLDAESRPWSQVLERFLRAGRALAAAHAAGLAHRNFTADSVYLDGDNVLVADLGITEDATTSSPGQDTEARADQYSFSVALWEGLHGQPPRVSGALAPPASPTEDRAPRGDRRVPRGLEAVIARGFSPAEVKRWPSMAVLLDQLERARSRRRRGALVVAAGAALGLGAVALWATSPDREAAVCSLPEERLVTVWSPEVRARLTQSFETADQSAAPIAQRVASALDTYMTSWREMYVNACRATRVTRTDDAALLDRRMSCLDRHLSLMRTLVNTLADSRDPKLVQRAEKLVESLPKIESCGDRERLMAVVASPTDATVRARIAELHGELDAITALKWRGEHNEQLRRAEAAVLAAREVGDPPILARSLEVLSKALTDNGKDDEATVRELAKVAAAAGMDEMSAVAWLKLLAGLTTHQASFEEARILEEAAHAAVIRAGAPDWLRFRELYFGAMRAANSGEYALARDRFTQAIPLATKPDLRAELHSNLARVTMVIDGPSAALPAAREAVKTFEELFGRDHTLIVDPLIFLAQVLRQTDNLEEARSTVRRALELQERSAALDSVDRAMSLQLLGELEGSLGSPAEAIKLIEEAATIFENANDTVRHALALDALARQRLATSGLAKARPLHQRALEQVERAMGKEWLYYAHLELHYAESLVTGGSCRETPHLLDHAAKVLAKEAPPSVAAVHWLRARCLMSARKTEAAMAELERADALCRTGDCSVAPSVRWELGKLLLDRGDDPARAAKLIDEARSRWASSGLTAKVREVDTWLAKR